MGSVIGRRTSGTAPKLRAPASTLATIKELEGLQWPFILWKYPTAEMIDTIDAGAVPLLKRCAINRIIIGNDTGRQADRPNEAQNNTNFFQALS